MKKLYICLHKAFYVQQLKMDAGISHVFGTLNFMEPFSEITISGPDII